MAEALYIKFRVQDLVAAERSSQLSKARKRTKRMLLFASDAAVGILMAGIAAILLLLPGEDIPLALRWILLSFPLSLAVRAYKQRVLECFLLGLFLGPIGIFVGMLLPRRT